MPADHPARNIKEFVNHMDLSTCFADYAGVGSSACDPRCLVRMILYEYTQGRTSPAQWYNSQTRDGSTTLKWLGMGVRPSRSTWYNFRDRVGLFVEQWNASLVQQSQQAGLVTGDVDMQDGTHVRACASRHHLLNRERLDRRLKELQDTLKQDEQGTVVTTPAWMARSPHQRRRQLRRYTTASEVLDRRLQQNARRESHKRLKEKHVVVSTGDPEAAVGRDKEKVFCPLYNVQYAVDPQSLLILAYGVFPQATDAGTLAPMLDRLKQVLGHYPREHVTDAGYVSILDLGVCRDRGVRLVGPYQENDFTAAKQERRQPRQLGKEQFHWLPEQETYACPQGHHLRRESSQMVTRRESDRLRETQYRCDPVHCRDCPLKAHCCRDPEKGRTIRRLEGEELLDAHRQQMQTPEAKQLRRQRGSVIERAFGDMKQHRNLRRLHGKGLSRVKAEIGLLVLAQNLLNLTRLKKTPATPCGNAT